MGLDPMFNRCSTDLAAILPKTIRSCLLDAPPLLYNWDEKLRGLIVGICLSRSLVLQSIAQTRSGHVKTTENVLSGFLAQERLLLAKSERAFVISTLKRLKRRRFWRHGQKFVLIIDSTAYPKPRSRRKLRPMPGKGKVRLHNLPSKETILVPGYQEIWTGLLMADRTVLPLTRRLWTERGPDAASLNLVEEAEMCRAREIVQEAFASDVILVADSGFRRKDLLRWLKRTERMDFVIRLDGNMTVRAGSKGLLENLALWWPKRLLMQWRDNSKKSLLYRVSARQVSVDDSSGESFSFNALCLTPEKEGVDPMFLATTLTTARSADLMTISRLYSWRWGIETFFDRFKNGLRGGSWRVFSCWEAIDNLLAAAHMAYLALVILAEFIRCGKTASLRLLMRRMKVTLRSRFARPPEFTLGRFFQILAMDFPSPRLAGVVL